MRCCFLILAVAFLLSALTPVTAMGAPCDGGSDCQTCCPNCQLKISLEDVKKHCYEVECKTVCIPRVNFPWQVSKCKTGCCDGCCTCCPEPCKGAKVKTVRVLKKYEYECKRCKYKWTPQCCGCDQGGRTNGGCAADACDQAATQSAQKPGVATTGRKSFSDLVPNSFFGTACADDRGVSPASASVEVETTRPKQ